MTRMMLAIAMSIAVPAVAGAQTAPAAPNTECCKDRDADHAKHGASAGADAHAGHGAPAPSADTHQPN